MGIQCLKEKSVDKNKKNKIKNKESRVCVCRKRWNARGLDNGFQIDATS